MGLSNRRLGLVSGGVGQLGWAYRGRGGGGVFVRYGRTRYCQIGVAQYICSWATGGVSNIGSGHWVSWYGQRGEFGVA